MVWCMANGISNVMATIQGQPNTEYDGLIMTLLPFMQIWHEVIIWQDRGGGKIVVCQCIEAPINSLAPGKFKWNFRYVIFKWILVIDVWGISYEIALRWMPQDLTDHKSTLVQVMAWCHQARSHYLNQCWPRCPMPYGVTRPQWVKWLAFCRWHCG